MESHFAKVALDNEKVDPLVFSLSGHFEGPFPNLAIQTPKTSYWRPSGQALSTVTLTQAQLIDLIEKRDQTKAPGLVWT